MFIPLIFWYKDNKGKNTVCSTTLSINESFSYLFFYFCKYKLCKLHVMFFLPIKALLLL